MTAVEVACVACHDDRCADCDRLAADDRRYPTCCCGRWFMTAPLPRTDHTLVQDRYPEDDWHAALFSVGASYGVENPDSYGVYVELRPDDEGVRLHVPRLGGARFEMGEEAEQDAVIRKVIRAAAGALGMEVSS